jgi:hypothetical protein
LVGRAVAEDDAEEEDEEVRDAPRSKKEKKRQERQERREVGMSFELPQLHFSSKNIHTLKFTSP